MRRRARSRAAAALVAILAGAAFANAREPEPATAELTCQRRAALGRVVCEVEAEVARGRLAWADVVILDVSEFARPLRSRVSVREATARLARRVRLPVGFIALRFGEGAVTAQVRFVHCVGPPDEESCVPSSRRVTAPLVVGPLVAH